MTETYNGLYICEGTSDLPLANVVETIFFSRNVMVYLSKPDFSLLGKVPKTVNARIGAGLELMGSVPDLIVVHRDADNVKVDARRAEIECGAQVASYQGALLPVIPVRMTEAWLLLDEPAIRQVAGNPNGKMQLPLPGIHEVERRADPKSLLQECILAAANVSGRRKDETKKRFSYHRRQLLERLDCGGPVTRLEGWKRLVRDIDAIIDGWGQN
ncbi:hypothetical protein [Actinokineospora sp.]|uniref:hypothetical protein n=1 Tax=Actinokineospora sp. TaxID=1872133 RepID=UPI0040380FA2